MRGQARLFDIDERLKEISAKGDDLKRLNTVVDFEAFRSIWLGRCRARTAARVAVRPSITCSLWKVLILQASHSLSDERTEFPPLSRGQGLIKNTGAHSIRNVMRIRLTD